MAKRRIDLIDFLKAFAIICVIIHHTYIMNDQRSPLALFIVNMAVPLFMVISGYTFSMSADGKRLKEMYNISDMARKILRFTIPTVIATVLFGIIYMTGAVQLKSSFFKTFILFKYGAGGYYYPLMIQLLLLFPLMHYCVRKYGYHGILIIGLVSLICELVFLYHNIHADIYRVLLFRYFVFIAAGIYLYDPKVTIENKTLTLMLIAGIIYLIMPPLFGHEYRVFRYQTWKTTSMVTALYLIPIVYIVFRHFINVSPEGKYWNMISLIGRASYHIMYTQMIFFCIRKNIYGFLHIDNVYIRACIYILTSVITGIMFYKIDNAIFGRFYRKS